MATKRSAENIILAAVVDDSKITVPLSLVVEQDSIDLVAFERGLVSVVADADREPDFRRSGSPPGRRTARA